MRASKEMRAYLALLGEVERRSRHNLLAAYRPYARQAEFHAAGAANRERLFMAGNQLGKTRAGGAEWAMHLTGRYPDWWVGKVFDRPVRLWAAGVTGEGTRDNPQRVLVGPPQQQAAWGTGMIPADAIAGMVMGRSVPGAIDSVVVRHGGGGDVQAPESVLSFKSYEKGREKWQGETLHGVWFDEEPPLDIYSEGLTRTNATDGITIVTFTPLLGMSDVVLRFLSAGEVERIGKE
ncbi:terminase large subunit domain-containing protein [Mesorhizobium sp. B1-1-8]|uniref:terminase large subunit domain-containing protein n=1 Tax=Mesorhizobium sp. B1-1-8 TaxID=2589976 RepID=UPI001D00D0DD|nr:terminase family protein [Mesorhizobium sp. B1-1-8]UCI06283.1 terminase family protein [Mesorhizobium sp. B1-1-8]